MARQLPTAAEAAAILARKRTRPQRRPPPVAGRSLNRLLKALDGKYGQGPGALQARWREIVGVEIARRTEPVKLTKPRTGGPAALEIRVAGASAALIQHQAPEIVARVNLFLGEAAVNKLRIVQGPLRATAEAAKPPRRRSAPLDAAQEAELERGLAETPDGPLKAALLSLGRGVLRRRTG
ncbi:DciA family protein [Phenylobacterium sp.]|uniref:DUF721 domain-containing protein n=1 Tax=Phenylobacterium sp. TaxID=1871053 RepID=UPI00286BD70F|nr:DciA family protein [Phenylobacterium sp.]